MSVPFWSPESLLSAAVLLPVAALMLAAPLAHWLGSRAGWPLALLLAASFATLLAQLPGALHEPVVVSAAWIPALGAEFALRLDGLALLFALVTTGVGAAVLAYSVQYMGHAHALPRYFAAFTGFALAMLLLVLADDALLLYAAWEVTTVTSFLLIAHDKAGRPAAVRALLMTFAGGLALLAAVLYAGVAADTLQLDTLSQPDHWEDGSLAIFMTLVVLAAAVKSVQVPFHVWLPPAMDAPSPVSAYLHAAAMVKAGLYLLLRLAETLAAVPWLAAAVVALGVTTAVFAGAVAWRQTDMKALLAYSTISQCGFMFALVGIGTPLAIAACTLHVVAHATYKSALFLCAGVFEKALDSRRLAAARGCWRSLPATSAAAAAACLSMAGVIPALGYVSKEEALKALLELTGANGVLTLAGVVAALVLTVAYSAKLGTAPFLGRPAAPLARPFRTGMAAAPVALAAFSLGSGIWVAQLAGMVEAAGRAASGNVPQQSLALWHGATAAFWLSLTVLAGGVLLARRRAPDVGWPAAATVAGLDSAAGRTLSVSAWIGRLATDPLPSNHIALLVGLSALLVVPTFSAFEFSNGPDPSVYHWVLAGFLVLGCLPVAVSKDTLTALATLTGLGFLVTIWYLLHGSPQVAAVQLAVDSLTVALAMFILRHLPRSFPDVGFRRQVTAIVAALAGGATLGGIVLVSSSPDLPPASVAYLEEARRSGVGNLVSEILAHHRAFDTLGEATVVAMAALGTIALLRWQEQPG